MVQSFNFIDFVTNLKNSGNFDFKGIDENHFTEWINNKTTYNTSCQDDYVGEIINGECNVWFDKDSRKTHQDELSNTQKENGKSNIVVILESPHTDEYKDSNFIHPALGKTGKNLQKYFQSLVTLVVNQINPNSKLKKGSYKIILMESIPYQCSLGTNPLDEDIRNKIFLELWKDEKSHKFSERIKSYNPVVIFNCCTKGNDEQELRTLVQGKINEYKKGKNDIELYKCSHPSMWNFSIDKAE